MLIFNSILAVGQTDSTLESLQQMPDKYVNTINNKIDKYTARVSSKTIKTLTRLAKWETKIKTTLEKLSPETAQRLYGNNQLTFTSLLQKIQQGEAIKLEYRRQYDKYRDDATTGIKYLEKNRQFLDSGLAKKIQATKQKLQQLNSEEDSTQALQQFIKERKKQLVSAALVHLKNNKYLSKISKECWYYGETMKNYKAIFNDEGKTEKFAKEVLNKIPGFQEFIKQNSILAGLFDISTATAQLQEGMQTRAGIQQLIQSRASALGQATVSQNLEAAHSQMSKLHNDVIQNALANNGNGYSEMPDFKPNNQKTKTFKQRIEYGFNIQFGSGGNILPSSSDMALTAGYKLNDRSTAGIGISYKFGMGSINKIRFSTEGVGLRSYIDWKLKKQFFISGGMEMNYMNSYKETAALGKKIQPWQQSALLGITKKVSIKSGKFKSTNLQLLFDFLAKQHVPVSQQVLFRVGYNF